MPFSTSSRVLAVRYMHMPRPNSKKWMFHDSSFIFSLAWGAANRGSAGLTQMPPPPLLQGLGWCCALHRPRRPWGPVGGCKPTVSTVALVRQGVPGTAQGHPRVTDATPAPAPAGQACTAVGLPVWAYPLGAQVLHGRVSLEESEQALGGHRGARSGRRAVPTAPGERGKAGKQSREAGPERGGSPTAGGQCPGTGRRPPDGPALPPLWPSTHLTALRHPGQALGPVPSDPLSVSSGPGEEQLPGEFF